MLLVGHSFGGGVAILTALQRPDRVGGLVLVNSIGGAAWTPDGELVRPVARRLWDVGAHVGRDVRAPARLLRVLPITLAEAVPNLLRAPQPFLRSAHLAARADLTAELDALRRRGMPVVVVWGRRDQVITDRAFHTLCDALGDPASITVRGGHNWLLADPAHFGEVMTNVVAVADSARWLRRVGPLRRWWRRRRTRRHPRTPTLHRERRRGSRGDTTVTTGVHAAGWSQRSNVADGPTAALTQRHPHLGTRGVPYGP